MGLICTLLGHTADPARRRWNGGLCFARCARCGSDLVRSADDAWQVPHGYRIVWRPMPKDEPAPAPSSLMEWVEPEAAEPLEWEQPWEPARAQPALENVLPEPVQTDQEPVAREHDEGPNMFEWPLRAPVPEQTDEPSAGEQPDELYVEPAAAAVPAPEHRADLPTQIDDFMDDRADEVDWDDYPAFTQRTATG